MNNEIEAQFLDINKNEIRKKLKQIGTKLVRPEVLMRRIVFDVGPHQFARVRDEGDKIVMTYKNVSDDKSIMGTKEVNVVVDNYENAILLLKSCGLEEKAEQESLREVWILGEVEICIDEWPWLPPFIEVEGPSEKDNKLMGYTDTMKLVNVKGYKKNIGKIVKVKITDIKTWSLDGVIIDDRK